MKTRKIISLLASLSMIASSVVALSTVAFAADEPTMIIQCTPVNDFTGEYADYQSDFDWSEYGEDYQTYHIAVKGTGLEMTTTTSGKTKALSGKSITVAELDANIETEALKDEDYTLGIVKTLHAAPTKDISDTKASVAFSSSDPLYPPAKTAMTITKDMETDPIIEYMITVDKTKPVKLSFSGAKIAVTEFENNKAVANSTVAYVPVVSPASVTLPISEEPPVVDVTAIKLDQTAVELDLNGTKTATLTATVEPADATDPTVTWTSSDENVATVVDGVVTAVATGETTITATAGEKSATCVVTVVDSTPKTLKPGDVIEGIDIAKNPGKEDNVFYYVKTVADGANAAGHAKITNVTLGESVTTSRTIAQLLGGEAAEGATIEGAIVVVISGPVGNAFDFEIVD